MEGRIGRTSGGVDVAKVVSPGAVCAIDRIDEERQGDIAGIPQLLPITVPIQVPVEVPRRHAVEAGEEVPDLRFRGFAHLEPVLFEKVHDLLVDHECLTLGFSSAGDCDGPIRKLVDKVVRCASCVHDGAVDSKEGVPILVGPEGDVDHLSFPVVGTGFARHPAVR